MILTLSFPNIKATTAFLYKAFIRSFHICSRNVLTQWHNVFSHFQSLFNYQFSLSDDKKCTALYRALYVDDDTNYTIEKVTNFHRCIVIGIIPTFQTAAARVRFPAGSGILISILGLGVCPFSVQFLAVALTFWWAEIQGSPPLCICLVFWSLVSALPTSIWTHGHLGCKSREVKVLYCRRVNTKSRKKIKLFEVDKNKEYLN